MYPEIGPCITGAIVPTTSVCLFALQQLNELCTRVSGSGNYIDFTRRGTGGYTEPDLYGAQTMDR